MPAAISTDRPAPVAAFLERGLLLRPLGNVLYFMPPYVITDAEVDWVIGQIGEVLQEVEVRLEIRGYTYCFLMPPSAAVNTWRDVMKRFAVLTFGLAALVAAAACGQPAGTLAAAAEALKASDTKSIEYSGTGKWFQFGQAASATQPWPQFDVTAFTASINYEGPAARVQMTRKQTVDPARVRPAPVEQKPDQYHQRHVRLEHGGPCRRSRRHRSRRGAAAGRGRRAHDGNLVDASRLPARCERPTTRPPRPPTAAPR